MAGQPGRSGGWNKLSLEEHLQRGTMRPSRHLGPAAVAATTGLRLAARRRREAVRPALVEGMADLSLGRAFVETCWTEYENWGPPTLVLLREAGVLINQVESLRGQRGERAAQRLLLSVLGALRLPR